MSEKTLLIHSFLFWEKRKNSGNLSMLLGTFAIIGAMYARTTGNLFAQCEASAFMAIGLAAVAFVIEQFSVIQFKEEDCKKKRTREDVIRQANSYCKRTVVLLGMLAIPPALLYVKVLGVTEWVIFGLIVFLAALLIYLFHNRPEVPRLQSIWDEQTGKIIHKGSFFGWRYENPAIPKKGKDTK